MKWIGLCAKLHNFVIDQNDLWTEEDAAEDNDMADDEVAQNAPPHLPPSDLPPNDTRRGAATASIALHARVVAHAIAHHRAAGTFVNLGRV